jgi:putative hemolysin
MIPQIVVLLLLLTASGFFSGSETAFFSLNQIEKEKLVAGTKGRRRSFLRSIIDSPAEILITILTGNMVVNLFFASLMDVVVGHYVNEYAWLYSILIGTVLVLIIGEMTPKNLAIRHSLPFFRISSRPLRGIHSALTPVRYLLSRIEHSIMAFLTGRMNPESEDSRILISSTVQIGLKKGIVHHSELSILESFLDFREKTAEDIMIPRTEIDAVEAKTTLQELLSLAKRSSELLLIPVYRENIDHIMGYINVRDLLPYRHGLSSANTITPLIKPIHPIPATKNLMDLLREIMRENCEMALVIDEYGGTAGIVTYQHLVEDFLYFFYPSKVEHTKINSETYRFPGSYELERVEQLFETVFESSSRTISGFVTETLEEIPAVGTEFVVDDIEFIVRAVSRRKVLEVEARKRS